MRKRLTRPAVLTCEVDRDRIAGIALIVDAERNVKLIMKDGVTCTNTL